MGVPILNRNVPLNFSSSRISLTAIPEDLIQPYYGHRYSGRDNDGKVTFRESCYQIAIFSRLLWRSLFIGVKAPAKCPRTGS